MAAEAPADDVSDASQQTDSKDRPATRELEPAFHNTILSTYPDGRQARLWLDADGGYRAEGRRGDPSSGHWKVKGDKLCLKQSHPLPTPFSYCTHIHAGGVGTSWTGKAVTGEAIRITLIAGRSSVRR
jgi:hypothetical protein